MLETAKNRAIIKPEVIYEASWFGGLGDSVFGGRNLGSQGRPASSGGMFARDSLCEVNFCVGSSGDGSVAHCGGSIPHMGLGGQEVRFLPNAEIGGVA